MIPALYKGTGVSGAVRYVLGEGRDKETHQLNRLEPGETSRIDWTAGTGFGFDLDSPERLDLARKIMEWSALPAQQASTTRKTDKDCLHLVLSWRPGENPTREEMVAAAHDAMAAIGMEKARALFVAHNDTDHPHLHIVASRINPGSGRAYSEYKDFPKLEAWADRWDREHDRARVPGRVAKADMAAFIAARDTAKILAQFTETRSTFTAAELRRALYKAAPAADRRDSCKGLTAEILADHQVVGLRETADAAVTRYTTRAVLAAERELLRSAEGLKRHDIFGLTDRHVQATLDWHSQLDLEQRQAVYHLTGVGGVALLAGEAGTGKSTTLAAVRDAYEASGYRVVGMAWKNDVVQDMARDGFTHTTTIAAELLRLEHGKAHWNSNTVLVVDEAAMLATKHLGALLKAAGEKGAKVILAGDDKQLASIEAGGMFGQLALTHGAAELHSVRRVTDLDQRQAFNLMHKGEFEPALAIFDKAGAINWSETADAARTALVARYAADSAVTPDKQRFIFAHANAEVAKLNAEVRAIRRGRDELGADQVLQTTDGAVAFAVNDRVAITANGRTRQDKAAGLVNGNFGVVRAIDGARITIELDAKKGQVPRQISFTVGGDHQAGQFNGFRHGYAGTIYKGQGRTLDQAYVMQSEGMRSAASYVALTRHRENVALFATRTADKWTDAKAGAAGLNPEQREAATAAYQSWQDKHPAQGASFGFDAYVGYVQQQRAAELGVDPQLRHLARQMGRTDDRRAASQFVPDRVVADVPAAVKASAPTPAPVLAPEPLAGGAERARMPMAAVTVTKRPVKPVQPTPLATPATSAMPPTPAPPQAKEPAKHPMPAVPPAVRPVAPRADFMATQKAASEELAAKRRVEGNQTRQGAHNTPLPTKTNPAATPEQEVRDARAERVRRLQESMGRQLVAREHNNGRSGGRTRTRQP